MDALESALTTPATEEAPAPTNSKETKPVHVEHYTADRGWLPAQKFPGASEAVRWIKKEAAAGRWRVVRVYADITVAEEQQTIRSVN
jgi:hypothetical protein